MALCLGCLVGCPHPLKVSPRPYSPYSRSHDDMHYSSLTHLGSLTAVQPRQLLFQPVGRKGRFCLHALCSAAAPPLPLHVRSVRHVTVMLPPPPPFAWFIFTL